MLVDNRAHVRELYQQPLETRQWLFQGRDRAPTAPAEGSSLPLNSSTLAESLIIGVSVRSVKECIGMDDDIAGYQEHVIMVPERVTGRRVYGSAIVTSGFTGLFLAAGLDPTKALPVATAVRFAVDLDDPGRLFVVGSFSDGSHAILKNFFSEFGLVANSQTLCTASSANSNPREVIAQYSAYRYCPFCIDRGQTCECLVENCLRHWQSDLPHIANWSEFVTWVHSKRSIPGIGRMAYADPAGLVMVGCSAVTEEMYGNTNTSHRHLKGLFVKNQVLGASVPRELFRTSDSQKTPAALLHQAQEESDKRVVATKVNNGQPTLWCSMCKCTFSTRSNLVRHMRAVHRQDTADLHVKLSSGTKTRQKYICHICGLELRQKSNLTRHIESVHEKKRPFKCPTCSLGFAQRENMDRHRRLTH